ncbi:MAG TPA: phosphoethanolamine--lipid A transferase [Candidatus Binatia bacterium]|nr:phosphoethanolamine--lipid A transferase [Candidatus Binatia bacterium]
MERIGGIGPLSPNTLIVIVAIYVALFANTALFSSAFEIYNGGAEEILFATSVLPFLTAVFIVVLSALCHRAAAKPILIAFLLLSSVIAYFMNQYGVIIDDDMLVNVLETDAGEASDVLSFALVPYVLILGVVPSLFVYRAELTLPRPKAALISRLKLVSVSVTIMVAVFFLFGGHYISMFREHKEVWYRANPIHAVYSAGRLAHDSVKFASLAHVIVGAHARIPEWDTHRELVVMVVGETARADHFSLNGYERETNPRLRDEAVINFPDVWSCGTSTAQSVPCIFSHYSRAEFDPERANAADNALDILKRAGVSVLWRDNNSSSKHVADRVEYEVYLTNKTNPVCDVECRDEGMLDGLQAYIDRHPKGDVLIVLHQMGNHGPAYYKRYPASFERFTPVCKTNDLGACSREEIVNAYDNAVLYTDFFLSKVIELLKRNDAEFETAMLYVGDHGESLGENGLYLHGLPYFLAPEAQKHVPLIMWFGRNFDPQSLSSIQTKRLEQLSHDNVFSTLLGLFEIQTADYDPKMDILDHANSAHF